MYVLINLCDAKEDIAIKVHGKTHDAKSVSAGVGKQKERDILNRENSIIMTVTHALNTVASFHIKIKMSN